MKTLDRYIGKVILQTTLIVFFAISGVEIFITLIGELRDIGQNHYTIFPALFYVLLNLPNTLYQFFPIIGLIGVLMGLGLLANHSELVVMQSLGLSPFQITLSTLKTIIILLIAMSIIGEVIAPKATTYATSYKEKKIAGETKTDGVAYDLWFRTNNDFFYVKEVDKQNNFYGLDWYHFDDQNNLVQASSALEAKYIGNRWIAYTVKETHLTQNRISTTTKPQTSLPFTMAPKLLLSSTKRSSDLSLDTLHQTLKFHKENHLQNDSVLLSFWQRTLQPLASLVMMLLAIPCVFGPLRQVSHSSRLVMGILIGFCFYYLNIFFGPIALLFHWPPLLSALLPILIFSVTGMFLLNPEVLRVSSY